MADSAVAPTTEEREEHMKYLALIYAAPGAGPDYGTPEFGPYMDGYRKATETYQGDGVMLAGEALQDSSTATTVRVRNGKTETMDGPVRRDKGATRRVLPARLRQPR